MSLANIRAVFFDAADTLFYIRDGLGATYAEPAKKFGVNPSPDDLKIAFSKYFRSAPPLSFGDISQDERKREEKRWWREVVKNVYEEVGMFEQFDIYFEELFEIFRESAWEIFPETKDVLSTLKENGYKLVMVSNFDSRVYDVCESINILNYFDGFIISSEAGYAKPQTKIFQMALEQVGLNAGECVHVGDDYVNDYICPTSIGINALFLDREKNNQDSDIKKIGNLRELIKLLP